MKTHTTQGQTLGGKVVTNQNLLYYALTTIQD